MSLKAHGKNVHTQLVKDDQFDADAFYHRLNDQGLDSGLVDFLEHDSGLAPSMAKSEYLVVSLMPLRAHTAPFGSYITVRREGGINSS